jgi:gliding motility-associated-like protein
LILTDNSTSCKDTVNEVVIVNPAPTASFTSNNFVCERSPVNFTNAGSTGTGISYVWDFGTQAIPTASSTENPKGILYSSPGDKIVTLTVNNAFNCTAVGTATVTILDRPKAIFASSGPQCTGAPVEFSYTGNNLGLSFEWDLGQSATPATSTNSNPSGILYASAGIKIIRLIATSNNSNCKDTTEQALTIYTTPNVSFSSTAPTCARSAVQFTNTGSSGSNWQYTWSFSDGASSIQSSVENPTDIRFDYGGTKKVSLMISDVHCFKSFSNTITIYDLPIANAGKDTVICTDASVQIGSANLMDHLYQWSPITTLDKATISNPTASPVAPVTQYIVKVTNATTTCSNTDSVTVTMLSPLVANAGPDGEICLGQGIQVGTGLIKGQDYHWTPANSLNNASSTSPIASPTVTTTYTLSVTAANCGPVSDEVTVVVHALPKVSAGPDDTIARGGQTQLIASGGLQYQWIPQTGLNNPGIQDPFASPISNTTYTVTVIDINGCSNTDQVMITVNTPSFWLPTAFTPDGNGKNDVLYVRGVGIISFEFTVFDRWGQQIFYTRDVTRGWDGRKDPSGEEMPAGAYVYYLKGTASDGQAIAEQGMINLIR